MSKGRFAIRSDRFVSTAFLALGAGKPSFVARETRLSGKGQRPLCATRLQAVPQRRFQARMPWRKPERPKMRSPQFGHFYRVLVERELRRVRASARRLWEPDYSSKTSITRAGLTLISLFDPASVKATKRCC